MSTINLVASGLVLGAIAGAFYLAILWISLRWAIDQRSPGIWIAGGALRFGVLLAASLLAFRLHPPPTVVISALAGFALARFAAIRVAKSGLSPDDRGARHGDLT
ncbi:MAG: ATP synthase subunit I [Alphaproteobacteria bacterium]|nr:ATP synthase subunit I [Alphaproteobacteria bacterium]